MKKKSLIYQIYIFFFENSRRENGTLKRMFCRSLTKRNTSNNVKLLMTGILIMQQKENIDILYTRFISEAEKTFLIKQIELILDPFDKERLFLTFFKAMHLGKLTLLMENPKF